MFKKVFLIAICIFAITTLFAQKSSGTKKIKSSTNKEGTTKKKKPVHNDNLKVVYVVQVMNSTDRVTVYNNKAVLYQMYPKQRVYVASEPPFYKLRLGFFSSKEKAAVFAKQIGNKFGTDAFVVKDKVVINTITIKK